MVLKELPNKPRTQMKKSLKPNSQFDLFSLKNDPKDPEYKLRVRDHYIQELAKNNAGTLTQINEFLKDAKFGNISIERIRQVLKENNLTNRELRLNFRIIQRQKKISEIINYILNHPEDTKAQVANHFGFTIDKLEKYLKGQTIRPSLLNKPISKEEREKRKRFVEDTFGYKFGKKEVNVAPIDTLKSRIKQIYKEFGYVIISYPVARISLDNFRRTVKLFERLGIKDWRDNDKQYYTLFPNSETYIKREVDVLKSVKANSNLNYLIVGQLFDIRTIYLKKEHQNKIDLMRNYLKTKDPQLAEQLFYYFESVALNQMERLIRFRGKSRIIHPNKNLFIDLGRTALIEVLRNCENPEKDVASFMALVTNYIYHGKEKLFDELTRTEDIDKSQFDESATKRGPNYDYEY